LKQIVGVLDARARGIQVTFSLGHETLNSKSRRTQRVPADLRSDAPQFTVCAPRSRSLSHSDERERGDAAAAARMAIWLGWDSLAFRGQPAVARGSLQRGSVLMAPHGSLG
jgi:hypothetical protein